MNQSFSIDELLDTLGRTVRSAVELVAKNSLCVAPVVAQTLSTKQPCGGGKHRKKTAPPLLMVMAAPAADPSSAIVGASTASRLDHGVS